MNRGNTALTVSAAAALVLAVLAGVVLRPGPTVTVDEAGGGDAHLGRSCVAYGGDPLTTLVTQSVHETGQTHLLGARATGVHGADGSVPVRIVPGVRLTEGYSVDEGILDGHRAVAPVDVALPRGDSTIVLTIHRRPDVAVSTVDAVELAWSGPLGTVRTTTIPAPVGLATERSLHSGACSAG